MRTAKARRVAAVVVSQEMTNDGFAEITLEINGRIVATTVGCVGQWHKATDALLAALARLC